MNRFRTAAGLTAAAAVIATVGLLGGAAQANAAPMTQSVSSAAGSAATSVGVLAANAATNNLTPSAFTPWICKRFNPGWICNPKW